MNRVIKDVAVRALSFLARRLGPYRVWRLFHAWAVREPAEARKFVEYILEAELPERPVSGDFLSRWLDYGSTVELVRHQSVRLDSPFYAVSVFRQISRQAQQHGHDPRRVLEIGPGVHLGAPFCFAASGCERVAAADIAPMDRDMRFYRELKDLLGVVGGFGWWRYNAAVNPYPALRYPQCWDHQSADDILARVEHRSPAPADALPFEDGSFDLMYSMNAFEHFPDPRRAVAEIARVLEPGGLTVHEIDMRYHCDMRFHQPQDTLKFLEWTDERWHEVSERYGEGRALKGCLAGEWGREVYCNRLRISDYRELFNANGLELLAAEPLEVLAEGEIRRERFVEPFRSMPVQDLSVLVARIVARKRT